MGERQKIIWTLSVRFSLQVRAVMPLGWNYFNGMPLGPRYMELIALRYTLKALIRSHGTSGIAVNAAQHPNRKRFTIAHELAHFLFDHKDQDEDHIDWKFTIIRRDGKSSEASDVQEIEANAFAACLLMPVQFLRADLNDQVGFSGEAELDDSQLQALARKYRVSEMALRYRLANLGLISPA